MSNHKYFDVVGEVIYRGTPMTIPNKYTKSTFFCIECKVESRAPNGEKKIDKDYFIIQTYKEDQVSKIREGYEIKCNIVRNSRIWKKNGEIQYKHDIRNIDGQKTDYGKYPIIFQSYFLISDITILDSDNNKEEIKAHNEAFENSYFKGPPPKENVKSDINPEDVDDLPF